MAYSCRIKHPLLGRFVGGYGGSESSFVGVTDRIVHGDTLVAACYLLFRCPYGDCILVRRR